jgi:hypothetical protein
VPWAQHFLNATYEWAAGPRASRPLGRYRARCVAGVRAVATSFLRMVLALSADKHACHESGMASGV